MVNTLDKYDTDKLKKARELIIQVYDYNFISRYDSLSAKLETVLKKIDGVIEDYGKE